MYGIFSIHPEQINDKNWQACEKVKKSETAK